MCKKCNEEVHLARRTTIGTISAELTLISQEGGEGGNARQTGLLMSWDKHTAKPKSAPRTLKFFVLRLSSLLSPSTTPAGQGQKKVGCERLSLLCKLLFPSLFGVEKERERENNRRRMKAWQRRRLITKGLKDGDTIRHCYNNTSRRKRKRLRLNFKLIWAKQHL